MGDASRPERRGRRDRRALATLLRPRPDRSRRDIHLGPECALEALALLGGGAFLPVHWGSFALAMHAWDQPPETLRSLAPRTGAQLLMPRLGEPVVPAQAEAPTPWWRAVDTIAGKLPAPAEESPLTLPHSVAWPLD